MSKALVDKIRKSRESNVTIDGHTYTVRRPTDGELADMPNGLAFTLAKRFVIGWDFKELDIVPGGGPEPVPFDSAVWAEWISDRSDLWEPIARPMIDAYKAHEATLARDKDGVPAAQKN
jgi:hypothetical protein